MMAAIYGLTPREQQVGPLAVHDTGVLRHILAKVGVASRGEIVPALFFRGGGLRPSRVLPAMLPRSCVGPVACWLSTGQARRRWIRGTGLISAHRVGVRVVPALTLHTNRVGPRAHLAGSIGLNA
jgi:hypothetical protein